MDIVEQKDVTPALMEAMGRLIPQLSKDAAVITEQQMRDILASESVRLLTAHEAGEIVGCLALVVFRIPTGARAWIEDVVVDTRMRGMGVGEALSRAALRLAVKLGAKTVDLTSRPSRESANRLYQRIGFLKRETNVYRWSENQTPNQPAQHNAGSRPSPGDSSASATQSAPAPRG